MKVVAVLPPKRGATSFTTAAAIMCFFHEVTGENTTWLSEHLRNHFSQAKRSKFMKEYLWFLDGWVPDRLILPSFPAIYPLCLYTPILAFSKPPPTEYLFLRKSPKPIAVHTAIIIFSSTLPQDLSLLCSPPNATSNPEVPWSPEGEKQRPVCPDDGPNSHLHGGGGRLQLLWLVRSEVHVVARRLGEGLTGRQRTCSEITPCLISVREGAKSMNTQQINAVGVGFFFSVM